VILFGYSKQYYSFHFEEGNNLQGLLIPVTVKYRNRADCTFNRNNRRQSNQQWMPLLSNDSDKCTTGSTPCYLLCVAAWFMFNHCACIRCCKCHHLWTWFEVQRRDTATQLCLHTVCLPVKCYGERVNPRSLMLIQNITIKNQLLKGLVLCLGYSHGKEVAFSAIATHKWNALSVLWVLRSTFK